MPYRTPRTTRPLMRHERAMVFVGAAGLAAMAGYINVVVLGVFHVPVSHMTGAVSRLSMDVATGDRLDLQVAASIVVAFFVGAVLSGAIIGGRKLVPGRRYGVALLAEGIALSLASVALLQGSRAGVTLAALACGIQNAMASSYFGLVLRTTHVTGIVTDLGVMAGHWLRHRRINRWKPLLLGSILGSFFVGGMLGHLAFVAWGVAALIASAAGCIAAGALYFGWRHSLIQPERPAP